MADQIWSFNPAKLLPGRSAFTTALWLCALISIPAMGFATFAPWWVAVWLLVLTSILIVGTFGIFAFHSFKNQHLLQSEDYLLKREAISIYGSSSYQGANVAKIVLDQNSVRKRIAKDESNG
jgi:hypothetical protein